MVLFVAIAPVIGAGAARLLGAEVSGLTQTRLTPRIADTAKALLVIYLAISLAETIALLAVACRSTTPWFTPSRLLLRGFSPKTASIGFYDSLAVEAVIVFFMVASGVSFSLYYLHPRRFDVVLDRELLAYLGYPPAVLRVGCAGLRGLRSLLLGRALRDSAFSVGASPRRPGSSRRTSTSGTRRRSSVRLCSCSSEAAPVRRREWIKVIRVIVIFRTILQDIFRMVHPRPLPPWSLEDA